jgi:predicted membrane protein
MKLNEKKQDWIIWAVIAAWFAGIGFLAYKFG